MPQQARLPGRNQPGTAGTRTSPLLPTTAPIWADEVFGTHSAAVLARAAIQDRPKPARQLTEDDIRNLITGIGDLRDVIHDAEPSVKAAIYGAPG